MNHIGSSYERRMMNGNSVVEKELADFLTRNNQCFYDRDIDALKLLYAPSSSVGFWDNHANCDTYELKEHIKKLSDFFENGKQTETGTVEPLLVENLRASSEDGFAVLTAVLRYQSAPRPGVRSSFVLKKHDENWKIIHLHHSFDPNETS